MTAICLIDEWKIIAAPGLSLNFPGGGGGDGGRPFGFGGVPTGGQREEKLSGEVLDITWVTRERRLL